MMRLFVAFALSAIGFVAHAQGAAPGQYTWEEFGKRIQSTQKVAPLGPELMGDNVGLSNGALSFSATDLSLAGSNRLEVAFSRSYSVFNRKDYPSDGMLADWQVDAPSISAVYAPNWLVGTPGSTSRCTIDGEAPAVSPFTTKDFWQGLQLNIPGGGELLRTLAATTRPTNGPTYLWVTGNGRTHVSCLASIKNGTGEGFLAITPDGTRYWFDWMAQTSEAPSKSLNISPAGAHLMSYLSRKKNFLYATRVEDRFGNYVEYTYTNAWNAPGKLTQVAASDGRQISVAYSNGVVSSVSDGTRTWSYAYASTTSGRKTLTTVTLPDASAWNIDFAAFTNAEIKYNEVSPGEILRSCTLNERPMNYDLVPVGAITHPSGAIGTFTVDIQQHGRSSVPISCGNVTSTGGPGTALGNDTNDDINIWATSSYSFTLKQKSISGPGLATADWNYSYAPNISRVFQGGATRSYPVCDWSNYNCALPPCPPDSCAGTSSKTTVSGPGGEWTRYSYGNTYLNNEGKLLQVETGTNASDVLKAVTNTYDMSQTNQPSPGYPARYGSSQRSDGDGFPSEYHRPLLSTKTTQQATDFISTNQAFDYFAQPLKVRRESSPGQNKIESYTYENNLAKWVIGQTKTVVCTSSSLPGCSGQTVAQATYDPATANQLTFSSFGKLRQTLTYNADGTVATVKDGNNNVTTLSSWYRSIPRTIKYPITPESPSGATQTAVVNAQGWITAVTDENGYKSCYAYDALGRMTEITYPSETTAGTCDATAWNKTTQVFEKVASAEYGIPAGHWRQTVSTGNARKIVYFDGQWRPLVTREYDTATEATTKRFQRFAYDHEGRAVFASYPGTSDALTTGSWTSYDALGRVTSAAQDTELTPSLQVTTTAYLTGFKTRVTNPRGQQTTTSYLAYDQPSTDWPVSITHPEGALTGIARDVFGKPTQLTRRNASNSVWAAHHYAYDEFQRLCKSTEVETGTTAMGYDDNGNLTWTAPAQSWSPTGACLSKTATAVAARRADRTYDARNRVKTLSFPDALGNTASTYTPDGLLASIAAQNGTNLVTTSYLYNKRRLPLSERMQWDSVDWSIGYAYNANGHLSSQTSPSGLSVAYAPNALGQPTQAGTYASGVSYFPNGAIKAFTYGNGIAYSMIQNDRQLPARSINCTVPGTGCASVNKRLDLSYTFDANANVSGITDNMGGPQTRTMIYDGLDRLTQATSIMFGTASYGYNALDNLTTLNVSGGSKVRNHAYVYDASNRLVNVTNGVGGPTVVGLGYDVQGNVNNKNGTLYAFDYGNRLRSVGGAGAAASYVYDGHGRRVRDITTGSKYSLYSQGGQLVYTSDIRAAKRTNYVYLGGSLIAFSETPIAGGTATVKYQHTDALGTPTAVTDASKAIIETSQYEPYGQQVNFEPMLPKDGPGYTGHVQDASSGLSYMQQRYYDPDSGRFLSVDPVVANPNNGALFNRYMYAANNPYRFFDPDGRCTGSRITNSDGTCKSTGGFTTMSSSAGPRKGQAMIAQNGRNRGADSVSAISPTGTANRLSDIKAVKDHFNIDGFGYAESMGTSADVGGNSAMTDNLSGSPHVTYGPKTLGNGLSWAGSVIGHEVEVHVPQFLRYNNLSGGQDFSLRELEAHRYNMGNAVRFQSPNWQIQYRQNQADKYYYQLTPENREKANRGNYDADN